MEDNSLCTPCQSEEKRSARKKIDTLLWGSFAGVSILYLLAIFFPNFITNYHWLMTMAHSVHYMIHAMWWGVVIGAVFVGILSKVPREFVISIMGKGGTFSGLLRATGLGVLLDLCSHGILMVAAKLYERGASTGQVMAFLLSSPWNSFSLTFILFGLIGFQWTIAFIVLSMMIALITGWVFDRLVSVKVLPPNHNEISLPVTFHFWREANIRLQQTKFNSTFLFEIAKNGIRDSRIVIRWLLFGMLIASILRASLDPSQYEQFFGPTLVGLMITVLVATVIEVCSEGSAPIAADILNNAKAPGNSFAFLMAGVSTDYTEIMILKDMAKSWKLALFLPLITVPQVVLIAWLINGFS